MLVSESTIKVDGSPQLCKLGILVVMNFGLNLFNPVEVSLFKKLCFSNNPSIFAFLKDREMSATLQYFSSIPFCFKCPMIASLSASSSLKGAISFSPCKLS